VLKNKAWFEINIKYPKKVEIKPHCGNCEVDEINVMSFCDASTRNDLGYLKVIIKIMK